jgi:hypothetical protein
MGRVCRVLNERAAAWLRRRCGIGAEARTQATVRYHQARNAAAHRSRLRYRKRKTKEILAL